MKKTIYGVLVILTAACSSPKYTANFQSYPNTYDHRTVASTPTQIPAPVDPATLVASTSIEVAPVTEAAPSEAAKAAVDQIRKTYMQMNKTERKQLRKHIQSEIRKYVNSRKENSTPAPQRWKWDQDLKFAAIFGAIGTTALIIGTEPFWIIGAVMLIVGVVFLVKWLVRQ